MKLPKGVKLIKAKYIKEYKFLFSFSNGKESLVDFYPIISYGKSLLKYLDLSLFKKIKIDKVNDDIYWGKDWDMCFHIYEYYDETEILPVKQKGGRKPIADKKVCVRLYVLQSVVDAKGGMEAVQEKATEFVNNLKIVKI